MSGTMAKQTAVHAGRVQSGRMLAACDGNAAGAPLGDGLARSMVVGAKPWAEPTSAGHSAPAGWPISLARIHSTRARCYRLPPPPKREDSARFRSMGARATVFVGSHPGTLGSRGRPV